MVDGVIMKEWNALRVCLQNQFSFYDIKEIIGLAGFDLSSIAHHEQKTSGGSSKGQLMTAIDKGLNDLDNDSLKRFIAIISEEMMTRKPDICSELNDNLARLGFKLIGNLVIPIELLDLSALPELPSESQSDLLKAAQRFRDGDLSGAISSVCGALDTATSAIYSTYKLGDPTKTSFQERCVRSIEATLVIHKIKQQLQELGWDDNEIKLFIKNLESSMNQGAYVLQTLRSKMGDVHGTKPFLKPLVFVSIKWTEVILRFIKE